MVIAQICRHIFLGQSLRTFLYSFYFHTRILVISVVSPSRLILLYLSLCRSDSKFSNFQAIQTNEQIGIMTATVKLQHEKSYKASQERNGSQTSTYILHRAPCLFPTHVTHLYLRPTRHATWPVAPSRVNKCRDCPSSRPSRPPKSVESFPQ